MDGRQRRQSTSTDPVKTGDIFRMAARSPMPRAINKATKEREMKENIGTLSVNRGESFEPKETPPISRPSPIYGVPMIAAAQLSGTPESESENLGESGSLILGKSPSVVKALFSTPKRDSDVSDQRKHFLNLALETPSESVREGGASHIEKQEQSDNIIKDQPESCKPVIGLISHVDTKRRIRNSFDLLFSRSPLPRAVVSKIAKAQNNSSNRFRRELQYTHSPVEKKPTEKEGSEFHSSEKPEIFPIPDEYPMSKTVQQEDQDHPQEVHADRDVDIKMPANEVEPPDESRCSPEPETNFRSSISRPMSKGLEDVNGGVAQHHHEQNHIEEKVIEKKRKRKREVESLLRMQKGLKLGSSIAEQQGQVPELKKSKRGRLVVPKQEFWKCKSVPVKCEVGVNERAGRTDESRKSQRPGKASDVKGALYSSRGAGRRSTPERAEQMKLEADSLNVRRSERLATLAPVFWGKRKRSMDSAHNATSPRQAPLPQKTPVRARGLNDAVNTRSTQEKTPRRKYKRRKSLGASARKPKITVDKRQGKKRGGKTNGADENAPKSTSERRRPGRPKRNREDPPSTAIPDAKLADVTEQSTSETEDELFDNFVQYCRCPRSFVIDRESRVENTELQIGHITTSSSGAKRLEFKSSTEDQRANTKKRVGKRLNSGNRTDSVEGVRGGAATWSQEEVSKLFKTIASINPGTPNMWAVVASQIEGKSAQECFDKYWERHPTPKKGPTKPKETSTSLPNLDQRGRKLGPRQEQAAIRALKECVRASDEATAQARKLIFNSSLVQQEDKVEDNRDETLETVSTVVLESGLGNVFNQSHKEVDDYISDKLNRWRQRQKESRFAQSDFAKNPAADTGPSSVDEITKLPSLDQSEDGLDNSCAMDISDTIDSFDGGDSDDENDNLMDI